MSEENFVGMWKDREDLSDGSVWVRGFGKIKKAETKGLQLYASAFPTNHLFQVKFPKIHINLRPQFDANALENIEQNVI